VRNRISSLRAQDAAFALAESFSHPIYGIRHAKAKFMATTEEHNAELMQTLDDAWNAQDLKVFEARHKPDVIVG